MDRLTIEADLNMRSSEGRLIAFLDDVVGPTDIAQLRAGETVRLIDFDGTAAVTGIIESVRQADDGSLYILVEAVDEAEPVRKDRSGFKAPTGTTVTIESSRFENEVWTTPGRRFYEVVEVPDDEQVVADGNATVNTETGEWTNPETR
jgi:hypothetical protein